MSPKVLRRCVICGKFHAAYLVPDHPGGSGYYCYSCWKARFANQATPTDKPPMPTKKILFLCTGNYYRSRFAEELFNHLARENVLNWIADSRGLEQNLHNPYLSGNFGPLSPHALRELEKRQIKIESPRFPKRLTSGEANQFERVIALDRDEHYPMIARDFPELQQVEYWNIKDLGDEKAESALSRLETKIRALTAELATHPS
jgi:protein-tyrosine phosphatase